MVLVFLLGLLYLFTGIIFTQFVVDTDVIGSIFVYLIAFSCLVVAYLAVPLKVLVKAPNNTPSASLLYDLIVLFISIVAVCSLFYDRQFLQGIDYFHLGIAKARELINASGPSGSAYSVFGNLFSYGYIIPLINLIFLWESKNWSFRVAVLIGSVFVVLFLSLLMGGRTVVLITLAVVISSLSGRRVLGLRMLPHGVGIGSVLLTCSAVLFFFGMVFYLRDQSLGAGDSALYLESMCLHLFSFDMSLHSSCNFDEVSGWSKDLWNYFYAICLYGFHSLWVTESIFQGSFTAEGGSVLLAGIDHLFLHRLGFTLEPHPYAGFFVPAPAAALNDLGWLGVVILSFALGALLRIVEAKLLQGDLWIGRFGFVFVVSGLLLGILISPDNLPGFILLLSCFLVYFMSFNLWNIILSTWSYRGSR